MKNQILNMGTILSSAQQKQVFGGTTLEDDLGGESIGCYNSNATCRTDRKIKCCSGSCQAASGVVGVCMP